MPELPENILPQSPSPLSHFKEESPPSHPNLPIAYYPAVEKPL